MVNLIGHDIGRYHIVEHLGQGGMAVVYKAYDTRLERDVAIKVIRMENFAPLIVENMLKRFEREGKSLAKMLHPNIVPIHDYGEYEGSPYIVMAYIPGGTLKNQIGKPIQYIKASRLLAPIARALDYAHSKGVLHRDVKPANILITAEGIPMLSDFGVAKFIEGKEGNTLTSSGAGIGTPEYMAPEQCLGKKVDARTDVYALAIVLYELLTGRKPYTADTPMGVIHKQISDPLPHPAQFTSGIPEMVENILFKALAKDPEDRYVNMAEFATMLEKISTIENHFTPQSRVLTENPPLEAVGGAVYQAETEEKDNQLPPTIKQPPAPLLFSENPTPLVINQRPFRQAEMDQTLDRPSPVETTPIPAKDRDPANRKKRIGLSRGLGFVLAGGLLLVLLTGGIWLVGNNIIAIPVSALPGKFSSFFSTIVPQITPQGIGSSKVSDKDGMKLMYVSAGDFQMGSTDAQFQLAVLNCEKYTRPASNCQGWFSLEKPVHRVYLDAFWIDQTEVTNAMYAKCVSTGSCQAPHDSSSQTRKSYYGDSQFADYPVIHVDWFQADTYCKWAGRSLPTEAQWEKAARGTDGRTYPWGEEIADQKANTPPNSSLKDTTSVSSYKAGASPYGALDMAGNVSQWVADWISPYSDGYQRNPTGPESGKSRVIRNGSFQNWDFFVRSAYRIVDSPADQNSYTGFRCAASK